MDYGRVADTVYEMAKVFAEKGHYNSLEDAATDLIRVLDRVKADFMSRENKNTTFSSMPVDLAAIQPTIAETARDQSLEPPALAANARL